MKQTLTDSQRVAIDHVDQSMAIVAGAGSGKTTVLIGRCLKIIGNNWGEIDRILAITFTEKAAAELKARLRRSMPPKWRCRIEGTWIGTFHACCARILRQHAALIGIDPSFDIIDENSAALAAEGCVKNTILRLLGEKDKDVSFLIDTIDFGTLVGALRELMQFRWHARRVLANPESDEPIEKEILRALGHVYKAVEARYTLQLARMGGLDFQELEIRALDLLQGHNDLLREYRQRFRHILIDEFQDTSDAQLELVLKLFEPKSNTLMIVGDPRQSIYRFRGANMNCFAKALEAIREHKGETIHLPNNFRSLEPIVDFTNSYQESSTEGLLGQLGQRGISPATEGMVAMRTNETGHPCVIALTLDSLADARISERRRAEATSLASFIRRLIDRNKIATSDIALLFQALTNIQAYESALRREGIPYRLYGGRGLLSRQEISDLMAVLAYAANPTDELALLGILRSPIIGLSDDDLVILAGPEGNRLLEAVRSEPRCRILGEIESMPRHMTPSEIIRRTLILTGYESLCHKLDPSGGMAANIERFISLAASIERQEPTPLTDFVGFVSELKERSARLGDPPAAGEGQGAVMCMTVHAVKGLEFPVVILPDLIRSAPSWGGNWCFSREMGMAFKLKDSILPLGPRRETQRYSTIRDVETKAQEDESRRLLYVAMTRARDMLILPLHKGMRRDGPWHRWIVPVIEDATSQGIVETLRACEIDQKAKDEGRRTRDARPPLTLPSPLRGEGRGEGGSYPASRIPHPGSLRPASFTVSELECHDRCPQEYYLKHVLGLTSGSIFTDSGKKLPAAIRGSVVHGVLARFDPLDSAKLDDLIKTELFANGVSPDEKNIRTIRREIGRVEELNIFKRLTTGLRELGFDWNFGGATITGSIDWLVPVSGGYEIIDFKTDDIEKHEVGKHAREYELQLSCYTLAAEASMRQEIIATTLIFLACGVIHRQNMDERRRQSGAACISEIIKAIVGKNFTMRKRSAPCLTCQYHHNEICWMDRFRKSETGI